MISLSQSMGFMTNVLIKDFGKNWKKKETEKNEKHAIKALKDSEFLVFTQGPRGGKNYFWVCSLDLIGGDILKIWNISDHLLKKLGHKMHF